MDVTVSILWELELPSIKENFPDAYKTDLRTTKGDKSKLGTFTFVTINGLTIINAYTQYHYGGGGCLFDYNAFERILTQIKDKFPGVRIGLPKIGCGLAGGDWEAVVQIIDRILPDIEYVEFSN